MLDACIFKYLYLIVKTNDQAKYPRDQLLMPYGIHIVLDTGIWISGRRNLCLLFSRLSPECLAKYVIVMNFTWSSPTFLTGLAKFKNQTHVSLQFIQSHQQPGNFSWTCQVKSNRTYSVSHQILNKGLSCSYYPCQTIPSIPLPTKWTNIDGHLPKFQSLRLDIL